MSIFAGTPLSLNHLSGCHGNRTIPDYHDRFIFEEHNVLLLKGPIEHLAAIRNAPSGSM